MSALHSKQTENHVPFSFKYANDTARQAATGFDADDQGKFAFQESDNSLWCLVGPTDSPPTWAIMATTSNGDMSKAVYDTNNDGAVDAADHATTADSATNADTVDNAHAADFAAHDHNHDGVYAQATHAHVPGDITNLSEAIDDRVAGLLTEGSGIDITYDDSAGTLTIATTGGGGDATSLQGRTLANTAPSNGQAIRWNNSANRWEPADVTATVTRILALGISGTLTVTTGATRLYVPWACTITNVRVMAGTPPTGADVIVDIHRNGTTIFTTQTNRPTITATNFTDLSSTPDTTAIAQNDYITLDVDQIGSTIAGANLVVQIEVSVP